MDNVMNASNMSTSNAVTSLGQSSINAIQGNVEAMMQAGHIWAAGCQSLRQAMAAAAQAHLAATMSTWKAMGSVKSPKEALELQTGLARTTLETAYADTGKLAAASMQLAGAAMAPIAARVTATQVAASGQT